MVSLTSALTHSSTHARILRPIHTQTRIGTRKHETLIVLVGAAAVVWTDIIATVVNVAGVQTDITLGHGHRERSCAPGRTCAHGSALVCTFCTRLTHSALRKVGLWSRCMSVRRRG